MRKIFSLMVVLCTAMNLANAQEQNPVSKPDSHAPIGVMGDHTHKKGEFMFSYRFMTMAMKDNLMGSDDITPETIVTTIPNRFAGMPGMPPTLRVVPLNMTMNMHMLGAMYAPSDKITLMAMGMLVSSEMEHRTYQGGMGTTVLGNFTTKSSGLGDTKVSALFQLYEKESTRMHFNLGLSIPTGSITETDQILTPMNATPEARLPYPMQLGSGTWDLLPGITYAGHKEKLAWGSQLMATVRLGDNEEDYHLGNRLEFTNWFSYRLAPWISSSLRLTAMTQEKVEGMDANIMAPVQTADPDRQGGTRIDGGLGVNLIGTKGFLRNQRLAFEFNLPLLQDLNGPQLKTSSVLTVGWQHALSL